MGLFPGCCILQLPSLLNQPRPQRPICTSSEHATTTSSYGQYVASEQLGGMDLLWYCPGGIPLAQVIAAAAEQPLA